MTQGAGGTRGSGQGPAKKEPGKARPHVVKPKGGPPGEAPKAKDEARRWVPPRLAFAVLAALAVGAGLYGAWPLISEKLAPPLVRPERAAPEAVTVEPAETPAPRPSEPLAAPSPEAEGAASRAEFAGLNARIAALEETLAGAIARLEAAQMRAARVESAARAPARPPPWQPDVALLERRLDRIEVRIEQLQARPGLSPSVVEGLSGMPDRLAVLGERIERLEGEASARATAQAARLEFLLAAGELREAMRGGAPFAGELARLRAVARGDDELRALVEELSPEAERGVPTLDALRARFEETANAVVVAGVAPEGSGFLDQTLKQLSSIVTVRRTGGGLEGDAPEALVARAEARLAEGNLSAAVAELERLKGAPAEAAAEWLEDARLRLAAEEALERLDRGLAERLSGVGEGLRSS